MGSANKIEKNADQRSVGELLLEARGDMTIREISDELCISGYLLEALEQGREDVFASSCYATGFLKNYSEYLKLDTAALVAQYKAEFNLDQAELDLDEPEVIETSGSLFSKFSWAAGTGMASTSSALPQRNHNLSRMMSYTAFTAVLGLGIWFSVTRTEFLIEEASSPINLQSNFALLEQKKQPEVQKSESLQIAALDVSKMKAAEAEKSDLKSENNQPSLQRTEKEKSFSFMETASAEMPASAIFSGEKIKLRASSDSWVRITSENNDVTFDRIIHAGEEILTPYTAGMTMMTSNAGALTVYFSGAKGRVLGKLGQMADGISLEHLK
jgi:cytoskeletal protein RodZ